LAFFGATPSNRALIVWRGLVYQRAGDRLVRLDKKTVLRHFYDD
jgi:hypothetical protein